MSFVLNDQLLSPVWLCYLQMTASSVCDIHTDRLTNLMIFFLCEIWSHHPRLIPINDLVFQEIGDFRSKDLNKMYVGD